PEQTVTVGQGINVGETIIPLNGFNPTATPVSMSFTLPLPAGISATFTPTQVTDSTTISIVTAKNTPAGTYVLNFSASAAGVTTHTGRISLVVTTSGCGGTPLREYIRIGSRVISVENSCAQ